MAYWNLRISFVYVFYDINSLSEGKLLIVLNFLGNCFMKVHINLYGNKNIFIKLVYIPQF